MISKKHKQGTHRGVCSIQATKLFFREAKETNQVIFREAKETVCGFAPALLLQMNMLVHDSDRHHHSLTFAVGRES